MVVLVAVMSVETGVSSRSCWRGPCHVVMSGPAIARLNAHRVDVHGVWW